MNYQEAMLALEAGKKLNRKAWGSKVICKKLTGADIIPWRKHSADMALLAAEKGFHITWLDSIWLFNISNKKIEKENRTTRGFR